MALHPINFYALNAAPVHSGLIRPVSAECLSDTTASFNASLRKLVRAEAAGRCTSSSNAGLFFKYEAHTECSSSSEVTKTYLTRDLNTGASSSTVESTARLSFGFLDSSGQSEVTSESSANLVSNSVMLGSVECTSESSGDARRFRKGGLVTEIPILPDPVMAIVVPLAPTPSGDIVIKDTIYY